MKVALKPYLRLAAETGCVRLAPSHSSDRDPGGRDLLTWGWSVAAGAGGVQRDRALPYYLLTLTLATQGNMTHSQDAVKANTHTRMHTHTRTNTHTHTHTHALPSSVCVRSTFPVAALYSTSSH